MRATFGYNEKLHREKDFQRVMKSGRRLVHPALLIYVYQRREDGDTRRLGLVTSRKVGTAVERNRLKRRLREIFRLNKHRLSAGIDVIFLSREGAAKLNYEDLASIVFSLWQQAGILSSTPPEDQISK